MRCNEFEQRLQLVLDMRAIPEEDALLAEHAALCSNCHDLMIGQQILFNAMAVRPLPEPREDFAERVITQLVATRPARRLRSWPALSALVALSAAVLLVIASGIARWSAPAATPDSSRSSAVATRGVTPIEAPAAAGNIAAGSNIWKVLTPQTFAEIYPPQVRQRHLEEVDRFANDLRPIARSFTAAASALRRTFPVSRQKTPKGRPQASRKVPNRLAGWA